MSDHKHALRVALVWKGSVFRERTFSQTSEQSISVGETEGATFRTPAPEFDGNFEMFQRSDRGYTIRFTDNVTGTVTLGGDELTLQQLIDDNRADAVGRMATADGGVTIYELEMVRGDWGLIELGDGEVFFQVLRQPSKVAGRGFESLDVPVMGMALLAGIAHLLFLLLASMSHSVEPTITQPSLIDDGWAKAEPVDTPEKTEIPQPEPPEPTSVSTESAATVGGQAGKIGAEENEKETEGASDKTDLNEEDSTDVEEVGVHKILSGASKDSALGKVMGGGSNQDYGKLEGDNNKLQPGEGSGGLSTRNTGQGGGGVGKIGEIGAPPGDSGGTGASIPEKVRKGVEIRQGTQKSGDQFCKKQNIQNEVKAKKRAIQHCYSKHLQQNPNLSGKVVVQWKIGLDGSVESASVAQSTMDNPAVGHCLRDVIQSRMEFAKPKGGVCVVQYPFVFTGLK